MSGVGAYGRTALAIPLALLCAPMVVGPVFAVQEYELRRFLLLKADCAVDTLLAEDKRDQGQWFRVRCKDALAFPDDVEIFCHDPSDDRSCTLLTQPRTFKYLKSE